MTIRARILLVCISTLLLIVGGVIGYVTVQMRNDAQSYYMSSSGERLRLMNDYIEAFVNTAVHDAAILANDAGLANAAGHFPRYVENDSDTYRGRLRRVESRCARAAEQADRNVQRL